MKQSDKRLIRTTKRKARRAKVKTEIDVWRGHREQVVRELNDLLRRVDALEQAFKTLEIKP